MTVGTGMLMLYLLGSVVACVIKFIENLWIGFEFERGDHPEQSAQRIEQFGKWLPLVLLGVMVAHLALLGPGVTAAIWPLGYVAWMLLLQDSPDEYRLST